MGILLNDEDIEALPFTNSMDNTDSLMIAKAQLKKFVEWGSGYCEHPEGKQGFSRRGCGECWQDLLKEVE